MGIQGLLPLLKSIQKPTHLRNFKGQTLGIDAYGWLHRGTVSCAIELAQEKPTRKHIEFALNRVRMLIHFGVKPYLVFDGDNLPSKAHTERERAARRQEAKRVGLELLRLGRPSQAHLELQRAVDVTPLMARELIEELKLLGVPYIVAPYEADSQLAFLEKRGHISGIISEDSDLLVFGAKCLLTKLDQYGECIMIRRTDFTSCREISLVGWSDQEFRMMAMLSGCDYLPGIDKMGLKTAYRLVRKYKNVERIVRSVQFDGKMKVPAGYLESFTRAEYTFLYQWVYCPQRKALLHLNDPPPGFDALDHPYIGRHVEPDTAAGVAAGELDPSSKLQLTPSSRPRYPAASSRSIETPDDKKGKPITDFFRPRRTPLAELDPNAFTPSPSQQRLLETQQGASWSASQAPIRRPPLLEGSERGNEPSSAPQASRRTTSAPIPALIRRSPKRQRLCSDISLASSMGGTTDMQAATSRFFTKPAAQLSPSRRKASRQKKREEFELWSDDSTLEAVAALGRTSESIQATEVSTPKKRKKLAVYSDLQSQDVNAKPDDKARQPTDPATGIDPAPADTNSSTKQNNALPFQPHRVTEARKNEPNHQGLDFRSPACNAQVDVTLVPMSSPTIKDVVNPQEEAEREENIGDEEWLAIERHDAELSAGVASHGSEDLLVPNSPGSECDDGRLRPKLDLTRFTFIV